MHDVFISYSSREAEAAETVRSILEKNRILCWMAPKDIPIGSNYAKEIPVAISECRVFVLMLSKKSQQSPWVRRELDTAVCCGKLIIPFMMEACQLNEEFNFLLNGVQRCDAFRKKSEAMQDLVSLIHAVTGKKPALPANPEENDGGCTERQKPTDAVQSGVRCPQCGSDQVAMRVMRDLGKRIGAGTAAAVAGAKEMSAVVALATGFVAAFAEKGHYQCKACGCEFEYRPGKERSSTDESKAEKTDTE